LEKQERTVDRKETGNHSHPTFWILESSIIIHNWIGFLCSTTHTSHPHSPHAASSLRSFPVFARAAQPTTYNLQNKLHSGWNIPSLDLAFCEITKIIRVCHCRVNAFRSSLEPTHRLR